MDTKNAKTHRGSCHCGAVRFQVDVDAAKGSRCNCSICAKVSQTGSIVKPGAFALLEGEGSLGVYEWGHMISKRFFCKHCGVHCFARGHLAELGGDYVSVNLNCLDDTELADMQVTYWDGRHNNWQAGTRSTPWPVLSPT
jgi:hypothetical protein